MEPSFVLGLAFFNHTQSPVTFSATPKTAGLGHVAVYCPSRQRDVGNREKRKRAGEESSREPCTVTSTSPLRDSKPFQPINRSWHTRHDWSVCLHRFDSFIIFRPRHKITKPSQTNTPLVQNETNNITLPSLGSCHDEYCTILCLCTTANVFQTESCWE